MSKPIKVGSIVTFPGDDRRWRTVSINEESRFARLEYVDDLIRTKVIDLDTLLVIEPVERSGNRTPAEIIAEFLPVAPRLQGAERKTAGWPEGRTSSMGT